MFQHLKNLIPYQNESFGSLRIRKFLSFALIIGLLQTFSWTYQIIEAPKSFGAKTFNVADSGTITVPSGVDTVIVTAIGGGGGVGGKDGAGNTNPSPGARGKVTASFRVTAGDVLGIWPGRAGSNGSDGATNNGGGAGGIATLNTSLNGGKGGNAGSSGGSGGGGGGGAASAFTINDVNTYQIIAGGAGGGGGQSNAANTGQPGKDDDSAVNNSPTGGNGVQTSTANSGTGKSCTTSTNDGGGGGGGGGGFEYGGLGGQIINGATGECAGDGGYRGRNWTGLRALAGTITSTTDNTSNTSAGQILLTFQLNQPTGLLYFYGTRYVRMDWTRTNAPSSYAIKLYNSSNTLVYTKSVDSSTSSATITPTDYPEMINGVTYKISITAIGDGNLTTSSTESTPYEVIPTSNVNSSTDSDTAVSFDGSNSNHLYSTSNSYNQIPETFTAEAWIFPTSYDCTGGGSAYWDSNDNFCHIVGKGNHFSLFLASSTTAGGSGESAGQLGYTWSNTSKWSKFKIPLNEWHHVAFSRQGSGASQAKLYVDGNLVYEDTTTANSASTERDFTVGASRSDATNTNGVFGKFRGQIDEVKLSKRFRTQSEIQFDMHNHNVTDSSFLLYYDFNPTNGTYVYNRITNAPSSTDLIFKMAANFDSSKIYTIDTTTSSIYTTVQFFRSYLVNGNGWRTPSNISNYRILALGGGGGGGGGWNGGGGGAGGYREVNTTMSTNTVYAVEVGVGGNGALLKYSPNNGGNSVVKNYASSAIALSATGGGKGATEQNVPGGLIEPAGNGGSGGGGAHAGGITAGTGNSGSYSPSEGYSGGDGLTDSGNGVCSAGGGGGAGGAGSAATTTSPGAGGVGVTTDITGSQLKLAGGGSGAGRYGACGSRAFSGTGNGSEYGGGVGIVTTAAANASMDSGTAGTANKGGGGGGGATTNTGAASGGAGGSGFIVIKYITNKPVIVRQPASDTLTVGAVETFTVSTSDPAPLTKSTKWQYTADTTTVIEANITGWTDVSSGSGYTTDTFTTAALTSSMNKYRYRAIITFTDANSLTTIETSTIATLTINGAIVITADSTTITRKYGDSQTIRTITYSGGTTSTGAVGTSTSHTVSTPYGALANGKIWVDTRTTTAYFKVDTGTVVGTYYETVTVTDYYGTSASYVQKVIVNPADTLTVQADTLTAITYSPSGMSINPTVTITGLVASDTKSAVTISYSAPGSSCANGGTCTVGDIGPAGGVVFYVSNTGTINVASGISDGGIYLEAAPGPFSTTTYNWCEGSSNPYTTLIGGTSSDIGTGASNTALALASCTGGAIYQAANLTIGGKSDWFLPSSNELSQMYANRVAIGLVSNALYWGSTENGNWIAASLVMSNGGIGSQNKGQATPYWPIRAFSSSGSVQPALASTTTAPNSAGTYTLTPSALTLANGVSTSNYVNVIYRTSQFTINKASQSTLVITSKVAPFNGNPSTLKLITTGGTDTGTVTYAIASGGSAGACQMTSDVLSVTSSGTCKVVATKAATINYLVAYSDTVTITFESFVSHQPIQTQSVPTQLPINGKNALETTTLTVPVITSIVYDEGGTRLVNGNFQFISPNYTINGSGFTGAVRIIRNFTDFSDFYFISDSALNITGARNDPSSFGSSGGLVFIECSDGRMGPVPFYLFVP